MKVLISIRDLEEAQTVVDAGGVDILDVKNPSEGTLGANHPWVIKEVQGIAPKGLRVGASIGDLDFKPGGASLAAYGVASLGVNYVTASMYHMKNREVGPLVSAVARAASEFDVGLIVAGYADHERAKAPDPLSFIRDIGVADYLMLDTSIKDGRSILDFLSLQELGEVQDSVHDQGLKLIIAGSLRLPHIEEIKTIDPDVLGFRGAVCEDGRVSGERVNQLLEALGT